MYRLIEKFLYATLFIFISTYGFSQTITDSRRKIEVTGSAETEVTPDIIFLGISLKEYFKDNNKNKAEDIETLERQLQAAVLKAGIPKEDFTINNVASYNYTLEKKRNPSFLAKKQYRIKITDLSKFNQIINSINPKAIQSTNIDGYDYSNLESLKKDLKIKALQAAQAKAIYLAQTLNDKLGKVIEIQEINSDEHFPQPMMYRSSMMFEKGMANNDESLPDIDFKKIKLNYQIRAVFELL